MINSIVASKTLFVYIISYMNNDNNDVLTDSRSWKRRPVRCYMNKGNRLVAC